MSSANFPHPQALELAPAASGLYLAQVEEKNAGMGSRSRAFAIVICCLAVGAGARAEDPCEEGKLVSAQVNDQTLYLHWTGTVRYEMHRRIQEKFDPVKSHVKAVVLRLSSCGGSAEAMKRAIDVLRRIKQTHNLLTVVWRGGTCASACIPIFLQGSRRTAARTSIWLFHEASRHGPDLKDRSTIADVTDAAETEEMVKTFETAGVSKRWLKYLRSKIRSAEWWQTGSDLWESKSGIHHRGGWQFRATHIEGAASLLRPLSAERFAGVRAGKAWCLPRHLSQRRVLDHHSSLGEFPRVSEVVGMRLVQIHLKEARSG